MLLSAIAALMDRDLRTLRREVEAYPDEHQLWHTPTGVGNSAGTLVLHLAGNLQHYVGARLGATGYARDRPAEFRRREVPRAELVDEIEAARSALRALAGIDPASLSGDFPEVVGQVRVQTGEYLIHLATHLAYHLGQVDYHRRVVTGRTEGVGAVRPAELSTARPAAG